MKREDSKLNDWPWLQVVQPDRYEVGYYRVQLEPVVVERPLGEAEARRAYERVGTGQPLPYVERQPVGGPVRRICWQADRLLAELGRLTAHQLSCLLTAWEVLQSLGQHASEGSYDADTEDRMWRKLNQED